MTAQRTIPVNGVRLRRARKEAGITSQGELSRLSGVSRSYITEIEKGIKQPSLRVATILAEAIGVELDELVSS